MLSNEVHHGSVFYFYNTRNCGKNDYYISLNWVNIVRTIIGELIITYSDTPIGVMIRICIYLWIDAENKLLRVTFFGNKSLIGV